MDKAKNPTAKIGRHGVYELTEEEDEKDGGIAFDVNHGHCKRWSTWVGRGIALTCPGLEQERCSDGG